MTIQNTIGVVAERLGVCPQTIRNWEKERLIPIATRKGLSKRRVFSESQVGQIDKYIKENYES